MINNKTIVICIPARYESSRLPGKPLALIDGTPMIIRVLDNMSQSRYADKIIVLTDDSRIIDTITNSGYEALMTSKDHTSGTDRLIEYSSMESYDYYINVQGDEPTVTSNEIDQIIIHAVSSDANIITPISKIKSATDLFDYNRVKCVYDNELNALYFSRQAIPAQRDTPYREWLEHADYWKHIGIYAFAKKSLSIISSLTQSTLEEVEKLEQLRWLQNGISIGCLKMEMNHISIDTHEDLDVINKIFEINSMQ